VERHVLCRGEACVVPTEISQGVAKRVDSRSALAGKW
jgi:hypothetical protein